MLDSNGSWLAGAEICQADNPESAARIRIAWLVGRFRESLTDGAHIIGELLEAGIVCLWFCTNEQIDTFQIGEQACANQFT
jgi:hypothetical protein